MESTKKMHEIVENMPEEYRKEMMIDLRIFRETIVGEISATFSNGTKLLKLFYGK